METLEQTVQLALERQKAGQPDEALALVEPLLQANPDEPLALVARGCVRIATEDITGAIADWEKALEGKPALAKSVQNQFKPFIDSAFYQFAFETTLDVNDPLPLSALGRACRLFGRNEEALRYLSRAIETGKPFRKDIVICAELYGQSGQSEQALQLLNKILESGAESAEVHYLAGVMHQQKSAMAFALKHFEKAIALDKEDIRPRLAVAELYLRQGRFDQAEPAFQFCLQHAPSARAHLGMAEVVKGQYRFDEALEHYRKAVDLEPENLEALSDLGALALQFGDLDLGVRCLQKVLEIDPTRAEAHGHLAKAAQQQGDAEQAIQSYRKLLQLAPNDASAAHNLGNLLRARGEYEEAAERLKVASDILKGDVQAALALADCYVHINRQYQAVELLKSRYESNPNHNELRAALEKLDPTAVKPNTSVTSSLPVPPQEEFNPFLEGAVNPFLEDVSNPLLEAPAAPPPPSSAAEYLAQARASAEAGRDDEALSRYRSALALEPKNRECLLELAAVYARKRLLGPAVDLYQQAYSQDLTRTELLPELVRLLGQVDDDERDETIANLILSVPTDFDRTLLLNGLWELQLQPSGKQIFETVARGLLTRFGSDAALQARWQELKDSPPEPPPEEESAAVTEEVAQPETASVAPEDSAEGVQAFVSDESVEQVEELIQSGSLEGVDWMEAVEVSSGEESGSAPAAGSAEASPEPAEVPAVAEAVSSEPAEAPAAAEAVSSEPAEVPAVAEAVSSEPAEAPAAAETVSSEPAEAPAAAETVASEPAEAPPVAESPSLESAEDSAVAEAASAQPTAGEAPLPESAVAEPFSPEPAAAEPEFPWREEPTWVASSGALERLLGQPGPTGSGNPASLYRALAARLYADGWLGDAVQALGRALRLEPGPGAPDFSDWLGEWTEWLREQEQLEVAHSVCSAWRELFPQERHAEELLEEIERALPASPPMAAEAEPEPVPPAAEPQMEAPEPEPVPPAAEPQAEAPEPEPAPPAAEPQAEAPEPEPAPAQVAGVAELEAGEPAAMAAAANAPETPAEPLPPSEAADETSAAPTTASEMEAVLNELRQKPDDEELVARVLDWAPQHEDVLLAFFRNITKEVPVEPAHFRNFARLYMKTNKAMLAVVQYLKYVKDAPSEAGYRELAQAYQVLNRDKNAADALRRADELAAAGA